MCVCCRLLDVLAGRKDKIGLSGHVLVDGATQPVNFKCMSGYVIQVRFVVVISINRNGFNFVNRNPKKMKACVGNEDLGDVEI